MEVYFRFPFLLHKNYTLDDSLLGLGTEEAQDMQPENSCMTYWLFWAEATCKTEHARRGFLWTPLFFPKDRSSGRNLIVVNSSPGVSLTTEGWLLSWKRRLEVRTQHHIQRKFVTNDHCLLSILWAHSSFQNITLP